MEALPRKEIASKGNRRWRFLSNALQVDRKFRGYEIYAQGSTKGKGKCKESKIIVGELWKKNLEDCFLNFIFNYTLVIFFRPCNVLNFFMYSRSTFLTDLTVLCYEKVVTRKLSHRILGLQFFPPTKLSVQVFCATKI